MSAHPYRAASDRTAQLVVLLRPIDHPAMVACAAAGWLSCYVIRSPHAPGWLVQAGTAGASLLFLTEAGALAAHRALLDVRRAEGLIVTERLPGEAADAFALRHLAALDGGGT